MHIKNEKYSIKTPILYIFTTQTIKNIYQMLKMVCVEEKMIMEIMKV
jgi:hypothetical protein